MPVFELMDGYPETPEDWDSCMEWAHNLGVGAYVEGLYLGENPYEPESPMALEWARGWRAARREGRGERKCP
jgi:hypothetical protein